MGGKGDARGVGGLVDVTNTNSKNTLTNYQILYHLQIS